MIALGDLGRESWDSGGESFAFFRGRRWWGLLLLRFSVDSGGIVFGKADSVMTA